MKLFLSYLIFGLFIISKLNGINLSKRTTDLELEKLKELVGDHLYADYMRKDDFLIPWLIANNFDLSKTAIELKKSLEWRKENQIDSILNESFDLNLKYFSNITDNQGAPVIIIPTGSWDIRKIVLSGKMNQLQRYCISLFEKEATNIRKMDQDNDKSFDQLIQVTLILDEAGYNSRQHACLACMRFHGDFIKNTKNYPKLLKSIIAINAPKIFGPFVQLIKPLLDPDAQKNLQVFSYDKTEWQSLLRSIIPMDQLPVQYGGTRIILQNKG